MQLGFARVTGSSMEPTYSSGDVLLVLHGAPVRIGSAHLMRLPDGPDGPRPLAIKRVTRADTPSATGEPTWWVERDNPREGIDSWLVGPIPDGDVQARVLFRIPPKIRGMVRPGRT